MCNPWTRESIKMHLWLKEYRNYAKLLCQYHENVTMSYHAAFFPNTTLPEKSLK